MLIYTHGRAVYYLSIYTNSGCYNLISSIFLNMLFKNSFENHKNNENREGKKAFERLAKELIFTENREVDLCVENIPRISISIQEELMRLSNQARANFLSSYHDLIVRLDKMDESNDSKKAGLLEEQSIMGAHRRIIEQKGEKMVSLESLKSICMLFYGIRSGDGYYGYGFTPALVAENSKDPEQFRLNCLGVTASLGAYCKSIGFDLKMVITPDHPSLLVDVEGKKYLIDISQPEIISDDCIEEMDGYSIIRYDERLMMVHDFDKGYLYEVLENFSVLRNIVLNRSHDFLPGSEKEGRELAERHKDVLCAYDWHKLQLEFFPDIEKSFQENESLWKAEIERVRDVRREQYVDTKMLEAIKFAIKADHEMSRKGQSEANEEIRDLSREYRDDILNFLRQDTVLPDGMPVSLIIFYKSIKEFLNGEDGWVKDGVFSRITKVLD